MQSQIYKDMKSPPGKDEAGNNIPRDQKDQSNKMIQSMPMTHQQKEMTNDGKNPIEEMQTPPPHPGNRPYANLQDKSNPSTKTGGMGNMGMIGLGAGALIAIFAVMKMMPK